MAGKKVRRLSSPVFSNPSIREQVGKSALRVRADTFKDIAEAGWRRPLIFAVCDFPKGKAGTSRSQPFDFCARHGDAAPLVAEWRVAVEREV
jgi:hypothetical protein